MTQKVRKLRWLEGGILLVGLLLLGSWSRNYLASSAYQASESRKLDAAIEGDGSEPLAPVALAAAFASAPAAGPPAPGPVAAGPPNRVTQPIPLAPGVLGRIEIPRLRISAMVAEGVDMKTLGLAVGHIPSTALPGSPGNCALAGHRDTFLRGIGKVRNNDIVRLVTPAQTYTYRVEWGKIVEPTQVDVLDSTSVRTLTLVTCFPFEFIGHAPKRFIVRARQVAAVAFASPSLDRGPLTYSRAAKENRTP